ncbi:hypothetical protein [Streptomyces parvulus]
MGHRPYPNRERAARRIDRQYMTRDDLRAIEGRAPGPETGFVGEYRLSVRQPAEASAHDGTQQA